MEESSILVSLDEANQSKKTSVEQPPKKRQKITKREDALPWDDYFMAVSFLSSMRSKDPSTQVGACIVNGDKRIVGIGYNGFPRGCSDDELPWERKADDELDTKYPVNISSFLFTFLVANSINLLFLLFF